MDEWWGTIRLIGRWGGFCVGLGGWGSDGARVGGYAGGTLVGVERFDW